MSATPRTVHLVVHTHWDREWYLTRTATLQRSQWVLQRVCDLLDQGSLPGFLFDGQSTALVEALEAAEEPLRARLLAHASEGRVAAGPWAIMADEFLVSGESLLRNLELGLADTRALGCRQPVGYLPDSFGHAAQMPEILQQFGLETAVVWRGVDAVQGCFDWVAPSGRRVGSVHLPEGYYQHALNLPEPGPALTALLEKLDQAVPQGPLLLTQGGDHLAPAASIAQRIAAFNDSQHRWRLQPCTLEDHVRQALQAAGHRTALHGELRANARAFVLPDVLSTRRYLKRLHQRVEDRLLGEIEPMMALLWPEGSAQAAPMRALQRCWRRLIEQQAHDSICGCSTDEVHAEMQQRLHELLQSLDGLKAWVLQACGAVQAWQHEGSRTAGHQDPSVWADDRHLSLFNPLPRRRQAWWSAQVFVQDDLAGPLELVDEDGAVVPSELIDEQAHAELISPLDDFPDRRAGRLLDLRLKLDLAPWGARRLQLRPRTEPVGTKGLGAAAAPAAPAASSPSTALQWSNAAWQITLTDKGKLVLLNRRHPEACGTAGGEVALLSELDAGDSYTFSPPPQAHQVLQPRWTLLRNRQLGPVQRIELEAVLQLPAGLDAQRRGAADESVECRGTLCLELRGDECDLHVEVDWLNAAKDQRTRLLLALPESVQRTGADSALAWIERDITLAAIPESPSAREMPVAVMPSLSAIAAGPWALGHHALQEFEVMEIEGQRWLGLTIVRSVGWLSRRDLRTRGQGAGPDIATPQAQCLGQSRDRFVLRAFDMATPDSLTALAAAENLRRPPTLLRGHVPPPIASIRAAAFHAPPPAQVSAVRRLDGRLEVRLWNATDGEVPLPLPEGRWRAVMADGRDDPSPADRLMPHGVKTLREVG